MARQRWRCQLKNTIDTGPCIILSMVSADQLYYVLYVLYYIMYYILLCIARPCMEGDKPGGWVRAVSPTVPSFPLPDIRTSRLT